MKDPEYTHHIKIDWGLGMDSMERWDEVAVWAIEQFRLPGQEYITDMSADHMIWSFRDERHAFLMRLRFGEVIARSKYANHI